MEVIIEANNEQDAILNSNCNGQCDSDSNWCICYDPNSNEWD